MFTIEIKCGESNTILDFPSPLPPSLDKFLLENRNSDSKTIVTSTI